MNTLPKDKQIQVIAALVEGCSIRSIERMYDVHRDTVMRLMVRTGQHCMTIMDDYVRDVPAGVIQCDELWTFVGKKDKRLNGTDGANLGSQYIFVAMDADTKLVPSYRIGKRLPVMAYGLMADLRERLVGRPTIITDGLEAYLDAVERAFGRDVRFAQLVKTVREVRKPVLEGYVPAIVVTCDPRPVTGYINPSLISTSLIERQNLTMRMSIRRLTRLTNAFSKKLDNLKAAVALHFAHYNFCRIHGSLRVTPAMAAGILASPWELETLLPS